MSRANTPPKISHWILRRAARWVREERFVGDLQVLFVHESARRSRPSARWWYRRQVLSFLRCVFSIRRVAFSTDERSHPIRDAGTDIRYALRLLRKAPGFSAAAVLTLALGIGANTAMFGVVYTVVLRPLSIPEPESLARLHGPAFSESEVENWREKARSLSAVSGYSSPTTFSLTGSGEPRAVVGSRVSANYFSTLGIPVVGRGFVADEELAGGAGAVVVSHDFWQGVMGGETSALGTELTLSNTVRTVVGILPEGVEPLQRGVEIYVPLSIDRASPTYGGGTYLRMLGRLSEGVLPGQATSELRSLFREEVDDPAWATAVFVQPFRAAMVAGVRQTLYVLLGAVGLVLLVACTNIAALLLARGTHREREIALRMALGASRGRVVRQLGTESIVLGAIGGVVGVTLAVWATGSLRGLLPADMPRVDTLAVDAKVLAFGLGLSLLSSIAFGTLPVLHAVRGRDAARRILSGGRVHAGNGRWYSGQWLVAGQIATTVVLLIGSALMLKSIAGLMDVDLGFSTEEVIIMRLRPKAQPDWTSLTPVSQYYAEVSARVRALPGVEDVGMSQLLPINAMQERGIYDAAGSALADGEWDMAIYHMATPGYFTVLEIPLVRGRFFTDSDRADAAPVAIINQTMARRLWPNGDAIGKVIHPFGHSRVPVSVIGVVADTRQRGIALEPEQELYRPLSQALRLEMYTFIRTSRSAAAIVPSVRLAVSEVDDQALVSDIVTGDDLVRATVADQRLLATLLTVFGAVTLLLGIVGVYGVTAFTVSQRHREFGLRLAIGARPDQLVTGVLRSGLPSAAVGIVAGLAGAVAGTRLLAANLHEVSTLDPLTFAAVPATLLAVSVLAMYLPARKVLGTNPTEALRADS